MPLLPACFLKSHTWKPSTSVPQNVTVFGNRAIKEESKIQFSHSVTSDSLQPWTTAYQASLSITNSRSTQWCHPIISSSVVPFSSRPQSFPTWGSFQMSQLFASGGQSIGVSASTSVLPMNIQDWSPLGWTGWISLQSKGFSRVFSNTTGQKHKFFGAQLSL